MGLDAKTKSIKGTKYRVTQLPFKTGRKTLIRITKLLGPLASGALRSGNLSQIMSMDVGQLGPAIEGFLDKISDEEIGEITDVFAEHTEIVDGSNAVQLSDVIDLHFAGGYKAWLEWLKFAAEVNFSDFLSSGASTEPPESDQKVEGDR